MNLLTWSRYQNKQKQSKVRVSKSLLPNESLITTKEIVSIDNNNSNDRDETKTVENKMIYMFEN